MENSTIDYSSYPANQKAVWLVAHHFCDLIGIKQNDPKRYWTSRSFRAGLIANASNNNQFVTQGDIKEFLAISNKELIPVKLKSTPKASKAKAKVQEVQEVQEVKTSPTGRLKGLEERMNNIEETQNDIKELLQKLLTK